MSIVDFRIKLALLSAASCIALWVGWRVLAQENFLPFDQTVQSTLQPEEENTWQLTGYAGDLIQIELNRLEGDLAPQITLTDAAGRLQASTTGTSEVKIVVRLASYGDYQLRVEGQDRTSGRYELRVNLVESNRSILEQGQLVYGDRFGGRLQSFVPGHLWSFSGRAGDVIDVKFTVPPTSVPFRLALVSPVDQTLATVRTDEQGEAGLLSIRLPLDGTYALEVAPQGEPERAIDYSLELQQLNSDAAIPSLLSPAQSAIAGRLTAQNRVNRYSVEQAGEYALVVEMSDPSCLVDVFLDSGAEQQPTHYVAVPGLPLPITITRPQRQVMEISTTTCPPGQDVDFSLDLFALLDASAARPLPQGEPVSRLNTEQTERWLFLSAPGDTIQLNVFSQSADVPLRLRLFSPNGTQLFRADAFGQLNQVVLLQEAGIYTIEVGPGAGYTLDYELLGTDGVLFAQQTPIVTSVLDIQQPEVRGFQVLGEAPIVITVNNPAGEIVALARSGELQPATLAAVAFPQAGQYQLNVYGDTAPLLQTETFPLAGVFDQTSGVKGELSQDQPANVWELTLFGGEALDLQLNRLPAETAWPNVTLLSPMGIAIQPQTQVEGPEGRLLVGFAAPLTGHYRVLVSRSTLSSTQSYTLQSQTSAPTLPTISPLPVPDLAFAAQAEPHTGQFLIPPLGSFPTSQLEAAARLALPESVRGLILPNQRRQIWRMSVQEGQVLALSITSADANPLPGLVVLDTNLNRLAESWQRNARQQQIIWRVPRTETYYVVVSGAPAGSRYLLESSFLSNYDATIPDLLALPWCRLGNFMCAAWP
ncbi:MAG: hypothetical protein HC915_08045, partial [Anaerolineae bacterium]|nr:hypothetical protein [Anaerolineae bacterium]